MPCVLINGGSMIKRVDQYFSSCRAVAKEAVGFGDVTTRAKAVSACAGIKYRQVTQGIVERSAGERREV